MEEKIYNNLLIEFKSVLKDELFWRRNTYINFLERQNIIIEDKNNYNLTVGVKLTNKICKELNLELNIDEDNEKDARFLVCNCMIDELNHVFDVFDSNADYDYLVNFRLHIDNVTEDALNNFDNTMRMYKQTYSVSKVDEKKETKILEFSDKNLTDNENGMPLSIYMKELIASKKMILL